MRYFTFPGKDQRAGRRLEVTVLLSKWRAARSGGWLEGWVLLDGLAPSDSLTLLCRAIDREGLLTI
jgi:hypothetical protein